jgi:hypothetical protein
LFELSLILSLYSRLIILHAPVSGFVDDQRRALVRVPVLASRDGERTDLVVWIDTAFNGGLAIPRKQVAELGLSKHNHQRPASPFFSFLFFLAGQVTKAPQEPNAHPNGPAAG